MGESGQTRDDGGRQDDVFSVPLEMPELSLEHRAPLALKGCSVKQTVDCVTGSCGKSFRKPAVGRFSRAAFQHSEALN
jgi:hypothetical protein